MSERNYFSLLSFCYVIFLYSGSGLLRQLSRSVRQIVGDSLNPMVTIGLLAFLLIFLYFRTVVLRRERIVLLALVLFCYGLALWYLRVPEERLHLLQYGLLTFFLSRIVPDRITGISRYLLVIGMVTLVGAGDEYIQSLRPNRVGDLRDVVINGVSATLAQALLVVTSTPPAQQLTSK